MNKRTDSISATNGPRDSIFGGWGTVKLTLTYEGPLKSAQSGGINEHKHDLRLHFHQQLREHWLHDQRLAACLHQGIPDEDILKHLDAPPGYWFKRKLAGFAFIPLVIQTDLLELICDLEIQLLIPDYPGGLFTGKEAGDLDGRIKTLFDALSMPRHANQLHGLVVPQPEEDIFCLLTDDKLITGFRVEARRLLQRVPNPQYARVTIRANIEAAEGSHQRFP